MKKRQIISIVVAMIIVCKTLWYHYSQENKEMDIYYTHATTFGNYYKENITIIANKPRIEDIQLYAEEIIEKCRNNDFKTILFSYEKSIPNELYATIYLNEKDVKKGNAVFSLSYKQERLNSEYNIVEHPEKFSLKISEKIKK